LRLCSFGCYGLALAALALVVFGAIECPPPPIFKLRQLNKILRKEKSCRESIEKKNQEKRLFFIVFAFGIFIDQKNPSDLSLLTKRINFFHCKSSKKVKFTEKKQRFLRKSLRFEKMKPIASNRTQW